MNNISSIPSEVQANLQSSQTENEFSVKRDYNPSENSTYSDNIPIKPNKKPKAYPMPKLTSKVKDITSNHTPIILDFDKVIEIATAKGLEQFESLNEKYLDKKTRRVPEKRLKRHRVSKEKHRKMISNYKRKDKANEPMKKSKTSNSNIYGIDNFVSNSIRIVEKKEFVRIECPKFREIPEEEADKEEPEVDDEDISDEKYIQLHSKLEQEEIRKRLEAYADVREKKKRNKGAGYKKQQPLFITSHSASTIEEKFIIRKDF